MSYEDWQNKQAVKTATATARVREKREGARCSKCGWIGRSCTCQIGLTEFKEFGGEIDAEKMARANEVVRLRKLDRRGKLIQTLLEEA